MQEGTAGEHVFDELKRYVDFGPADEASLHALGPRVTPHIPHLVAEFYQHIQRHPGASQAITGGQDQVQRLQGTLEAWVARLFQGPWDHAYYEQRARIGRRHVQIRLPQQYVFTAMDVIRRHLADIILDGPDGPAQVRAQLHAVDKLLDMELAIMLLTYQEDNDAALGRSERLAAFGQLVATIGHELRNPLAVMESSLYLLRAKLGPDERVARHLDQMGAQIKTSNQIITDLLEMVRERPVQRQTVEVQALVDRALEAWSRPAGMVLRLDIPPALPRVGVDPGQVHQVLVNLFTNAGDAAGPGGTLAVQAWAAEGQVALRVNDSGPGIDPAIRGRLFEPLVTTKARGVGLGLALCRKLAERNGGSIGLDQGPLPGAAFLLRLPGTGA